MNNDITNDWLKTHQLLLQELAFKYNVRIGEVLEIAELYLIINCTTDVLYLYDHLNCYDNEELKNDINHFVCKIF